MTIFGDNLVRLETSAHADGLGGRRRVPGPARLLMLHLATFAVLTFGCRSAKPTSTVIMRENSAPSPSATGTNTQVDRQIGHMAAEDQQRVSEAVRGIPLTKKRYRDDPIRRD